MNKTSLKFFAITAISIFFTLSSKGQNLQIVTEAGNTTSKDIFLLGTNNGLRLQNGPGTSFWVNTPGLNLMSIGGTGGLVPTSGAINITSGGKVGIGTTTPSQKFVVSNGGAEGMETYVEGTGIVGLQAYNRQTAQYAPMEIDASTFYFNHGNVGIGTSTPQSKLAVAGTITAQRVKVTTTGRPDFVFRNNYQLPTLQDIEKYVLEHKHLPDMPSAEEVERDGADLGEVNKKLLQKIEELTLHLIQQQKEIIALKDRVEKIEEK